MLLNFIQRSLGIIGNRAVATQGATPGSAPQQSQVPGSKENAFELHHVNTLLHERDLAAASGPKENGAARWASSGKLAVALVLGVTATYLVLEARWALGFLDALGTATTTPTQIQDIEFTGRCLSAFGLMWLWGKTRFLCTKEGFGHYSVDAIIAGAAVFALFGLIGAAYDWGISSLSKETSMQVFELGANRVWALQKKLPDTLQAQLRPATKEAVSMALWPLLTFDDGTSKRLHDNYEHQRTTGPTEAIDKLLKAYPDIQKTKAAQATVQSKYQDFLTQGAQLGKATNEANQADKKWYLDKAGAQAEVTKVSNLVRAFTDSWGSPPNPNATFEQFVDGTRHSKYADVQRIGAALAGHGTKPEDFMLVDLPGLRITGADVVNLNQQQYEDFIHRKFKTLVDDTLPSMATVKENPLAHDVIASVVLPPVAMLLSLLSVIMNSASMAGVLAGRVQSKLKSLAWLLPATALALAYALVPPMALPGLSAAQRGFTATYPIAGGIAARVATVDSYLLNNL